MTDVVYQAIAQAASGYIVAPAGCGKTEAIVRAVGNYCNGTQLILTHTHAGVDALKHRFRKSQILSSKYHIDTISGWVWNWVRKYPINSNYKGSTYIADWSNNNIYIAMSALLLKGFVQNVILNSYTGIIIDEYQDCTIPMHNLIIQLKKLLPCRILGDPLQGIFDFPKAPVINWTSVENDFKNNLGDLTIPYRWIKSKNQLLGQWLLEARSSFIQNKEPDFKNSPIIQRTFSLPYLGIELKSLANAQKGRICVIGPKSRRLPTGVETVLTNASYRLLETNDLKDLRKLIIGLTDTSPIGKASAALKFFISAFSSLGSHKNFIEKMLEGTCKRPKHSDRKVIFEMHTQGTTPQLILALLRYIEQQDEIFCKLNESVSVLKCILEEFIISGVCIKALYNDEILKRKYQNRSNVFRCIGSTLLVKGLEFDHCIIIRDQNWGTNKDLYVALTRGSKSVTLINLE